MKSKNLGPIVVRSMFALTVFATVTYAQTITPLPATQLGEAANNLEIRHSAVTTITKDLSALTAGRLFVVRPNDRLQLDLRSRKAKTAESKFDSRTSPAASAEESESESQDDPSPQPAKPASNGSNPVDLITRVEMKYQFQNFGSGYLHGVPVIRGDYAFTHTVSFRMDLPILAFDSKTPGARSESGIGDIVTSMTFVKVLSKKFVGAFVPRIDFPTASHASLGSGKYAFKPLVAGVTPLGKGLAFVGVLEYRVSFAGNKNRADINELSLKPILLKAFLDGPLKGYYVNPKLEVVVDFENNNRTTLQAGAEFGKALNKNVVLFAIPTAHVAGTKKESFKLELGFRYLFR